MITTGVITPSHEIISEPTAIEPKYSTTQLIRENKAETFSKESRYNEISLGLKISHGKLSDIVKVITYMKSKFNQLTVKIYISAKDGEINTSEYEDKIKEAIIQTGIEVEEEKLK